MATNDFKQLLQHHLNQTRAGLYGQFEHAFNFNEGADQDALMKIGPGQSITFSGELLDGQPCSLIASNNLTSTSGAGFAAQPEDVDGLIVTIPVTPKKGNATLEFSCPTAGGTTETVSYVTDTSVRNEDRWEAIDENNMVIFSKKTSGTSGSTTGIVRSDAGDYYVSGIDIGVRKYDADGVLQFRGWAGAGNYVSFVAYDPVHNVVAGYARTTRGSGATNVVGFNAAGPDQGDSGEPDALYQTFTSLEDGTGRRRAADFKADGNGFFIVAVIRNNGYAGAAGTFATILKLDALTGDIVATYDTNSGGGVIRIAIDPATGNIAIASINYAIPTGGSSNANVIVVDSDLNYISSVGLFWAEFTPFSGPFVCTPTFDAESRVYLLGAGGYMARYNSSLTTREVEVSLFDPPFTTNGRFTLDMGHNGDELIVFAGGPAFNNRGIVFRFDNDGNELSQYDVNLPASTIEMGHVLVGGPVAGPDLGTVFTQERSKTPPGRIEAIAAVKYAAGNITGIFFNSVNVEFDHSKWTAVHSVNGPVPIGSLSPGWEYNSPL